MALSVTNSAILAGIKHRKNEFQFDNAGVTLAVLGNSGCCINNNCLLLRMSLEEAVGLVIECREGVKGIRKEEKNDFIRDKIRGCSNGVTTGGYLQIRYKISSGLRTIPNDVCEQTFRMVWCLSNYRIRVAKEVNIMYIILYFLYNIILCFF